MSQTPPDYPPCLLDALRHNLLATLAQQDALVLEAPPGSGKSSRVPLWLLHAPWLAGKKICLLEPRRIAARALGRYMARLLGEAPGHSVGWRMRDETVCSPRTRIEVVTEGVLVRILQTDPELADFGCIIFDEFHERSLQSDLALALCLESKGAFRPDLRLVVMSATLDGEAVARLVGGCPVLRGTGRSHPVEQRWMPPRGTGWPPDADFWRHTAAVICNLLHTEHGSLLAFLPGSGEIRHLEGLLQGRLPAATSLHPLYGNLSAQKQDTAIAPPAPGQRKVVLATSIAETSLTIEGVRLVVDTGLARWAVHDSATGAERLVTGRISLEGATQRAGRAGRLGPGICCRLWHREEENALPRRFRPEILDADLGSLVLQLALWGVSGLEAIQSLAWLDTPPAAALTAAQNQLRTLGALDARGRITPMGEKMARLPLRPRMARLLLHGDTCGCPALACCLAALLEERDPLWKSGQTPDSNLAHRLDWLCRMQNPAAAALRRTAERLARHIDCKGDIFTAALAKQDASGSLLASAWPDRLAMRQQRQDGEIAWILRQGSAVRLPETDSLATSQFLAVASFTGGARGRIRLAAPLPTDRVAELFATDITNTEEVTISAELRVQARRIKRLGNIVLEVVPLPCPSPEDCTATLCAWFQQEGAASIARLPWSDVSQQWRARLAFLREHLGEHWPCVDDAALLEQIELWLAPLLRSANALRELRPESLHKALQSLLPYPQASELERLAPARWQAPSGIWHPIVYGDVGGPWLSARLQEFFGCENGPTLLEGRVPVRLHLDSPAGRPLQVTQDLAHFWRNGYAAVRAEMRGRYPRHPWPENPLTATPTALTSKKLAARQVGDSGIGAQAAPKPAQGKAKT